MNPDTCWNLSSNRSEKTGLNRNLQGRPVQSHLPLTCSSTESSTCTLRVYQREKPCSLCRFYRKCPPWMIFPEFPSPYVFPIVGSLECFEWRRTLTSSTLCCSCWMMAASPTLRAVWCALSNQSESRRANWLVAEVALFWFGHKSVCLFFEGTPYPLFWWFKRETNLGGPLKMQTQMDLFDLVRFYTLPRKFIYFQPKGPKGHL